MFFSCPHCRELVATDRETRLPPPMCPRCGGALREESNDANAAPAATENISTPGSRSIASFLRGGESKAESESASSTLIATQASSDDLGTPDVQATDTRFDDLEIVQQETPEVLALQIEETAVPDTDVAVQEIEPANAPVAPAAMPSVTEQPPSTPSFTR